MQIDSLKANIVLTAEDGQTLTFNLTTPKRKLGTVSECAEALMDTFLAAFEKICGIKYDGGELIKKHEATIKNLEKKVTELTVVPVAPVPAYSDPEDTIHNEMAKKAKHAKKHEK